MVKPLAAQRRFGSSEREPEALPSCGNVLSLRTGCGRRAWRRSAGRIVERRAHVDDAELAPASLRGSADRSNSYGNGVPKRFR